MGAVGNSISPDTAGRLGMGLEAVFQALPGGGNLSDQAVLGGMRARGGAAYFGD